jgi:hypothetical protein
VRIVAAIQGKLEEEMAKEARSVGRAVEKAVTETTNETKNLARAHIASRLGRRAGFLLTSRVYKNGPTDQAGFVYSRWKRARAGGKSSAQGPVDVLAAYQYGAQIEPRRGKFLYVPVVRGQFGRRARRIFQEGVGKGNVDLIPFQDKNGNLAYAVTERRRRGRGKLIAFLFQRVEVKRELDLEPIYRLGERSLTSRLVRNLNADAA